MPRFRITLGGALFGLTLVLVATGAVLSANNLLFLILAAMLATLLVSGLISRLVLAGLELELILPGHVAARQRAHGRLVLRNLKRLLPTFSVLIDSPELEAPLYFPVIRGGERLEEPADLVFPARGAFGKNLFTLTTRFPFGFLEKSARVTIRKDTVVYPSLEGAPGYDGLAQALAGEVELMVRGQGRDFYRIRPYDANESARHIDWKSTAHTGELQLREYTSEQQDAVRIYFDTRVPPGAEPWFETAVESCACVVWELAARDIPVHLRARRFEALVPDEEDVYAILKYLALVEPQLELSPDPAPIIDEAPVHLLFSAFPGGIPAAHVFSPPRPGAAP